MKMNHEFQPVILAAGGGSRMYPLTEEIPKALLPIGNIPMIWYPISYLKRLGFEEIIIVVLKSTVHQFNLAFKVFNDQTLKLDIVTISEEEELQTADSLRYLKDKIKCDLLIVSCDAITDAPFHHLADLHRARSASLTVLLAPQVDVASEKDAAAAGKKGTQAPASVQCDYVAIDGKEKRLLFLSNEADLDLDSVVVKKSLLKRYPSIVIRNNLTDMHLYIFKKWVLDYIDDNKSLGSIKGDAIPHIVGKQFSKRPSEAKDGQSPTSETLSSFPDGDPKPDIFSFADDMDEYTKLTKEWSFFPTNDSGSQSYDSIKCHAFVSDGDFCLRANTIQAYMYINRQITKLLPSLLPSQEFKTIHPSVNKSDRSQIGADCLVGESTTIGESVSVKKSIVGKHCIIKNKVKISNSVIMDHVTIEEGCNIQGSIICNNVYIKTKSSLKDCQVGHGLTIKEEADIKGEVVVQEVMDFDD